MTVLLGAQCRPSGYLTKLRIANIDEAKRDSVTPPLWEIEAKEPRAVPEVQIGVVPEGFVERVNNVASQGIAERLSIISFFKNNTFGTVLSVAKIEEGKVLATDDRVMTQEEFRKAYGCDD